jgi:hypothetical protein
MNTRVLWQKFMMTEMTRSLAKELRLVSIFVFSLTIFSFSFLQSRFLMQRLCYWLQAVLGRMLDPYVLLGMMALLPLLESIDTLICWAQRSDVFICNFVGALDKCHIQLFTYYKNQDTRFRREEFHAFNQLIDYNHETILLKWDAF